MRNRFIHGGIAAAFICLLGSGAQAAPPETASAQKMEEKLFCWRHSFVRGAGAAPGECGAGEEKDAGLCYPACKDGYNGIGPMCWAKCPAGSGDACKKDSYSRGLGELPACKNGQVSSAGLCYDACPDGYKGVAASCFSVCPPEMPVNCGAACAATAADCGASIAEMSLNTGMVLVNIVSIAVGAPGVSQAFKTAAQAGMIAAQKAVVAGGYQSLTRFGPRVALGVAVGAKSMALKFAKTFIVTHFKNQFIKSKMNLFSNMFKVARTGLPKGLSLASANEMADEVGMMQASGTFDWSILTTADVTGIGAMAHAFAKHPTCRAEDVSADVDAIDFGPGPTPSEARKSVELTFSARTTVTEITSSPLVGAEIIPTSNCSGREFRVGDKCQITVAVKGASKITGEIRIYTSQYHTFPLPIAVTANTASKTEHEPAPEADEAVNLSSIAGVWAFGRDQSKKILINENGGVYWFHGSRRAEVHHEKSRIVSVFRDSGKITVLDPIARTYSIKMGGDAPIVVTLSPEHESFTFPASAPQPFANGSAVRRPWSVGCAPGEQLYAGACYDIPVDYAITTPGIIGKICELGYRDDGTSCWPRWEGKKVPGQADPDATYAKRFPLVVTDCYYSKAKGNECPRNFNRTAACTCQADPSSKRVRAIMVQDPTVPRRIEY